MADQQHPLSRAVAGDLVESPDDPCDRLAPALAAGEGLVEPSPALRVEARPRHPVHPPVVALAQPPVEHDGDPRALERDARGLDGPIQVGRDDDIDAIVASARPEGTGLLAPRLGELAAEPPGRPANLVIDARGVRLVDELNAHGSLEYHERARRGASLRE
jgi:hypothetical protein